MKDIGISMRDEVLGHKKRDGRGSDGRYCFWTMKVPKDILLDKLWVANHGKWVGYFNIFDWTDNEVHFYSDSWVDDIRGERKPFMGFTYKVPLRVGMEEVGEKK
jgi:hypothetical protein